MIFMNNKNSNLAIGIAMIFEIMLAITTILGIALRQAQNLGQIILAGLCITIPFIITYVTNKKKILLPSNFQLISVLFIILTLYFGEIKKFYVKFWWWDLFLHGLFGCYAVIIALNIIQGIIIKEKGTTEKRFIIFTLIFAFSFSITLGTLWEMFEFIGDYFFKTDMVNGGLEDTASDLIIKILFAFITSIVWYCYKSKKKK